MLVIFFLSSRRRHTRFDCDWSSDVCSSDLERSAIGAAPPSSGAAAPTPIRPSPGIRRSRYSRVAGTSRVRRRRSEEHTSELQSQSNLVCRLLLEKKKKRKSPSIHNTLSQTV